LFWQRLTYNFGWKLGALALAVLLWFAVQGEPELVTIQAVPVLYRNLPSGLMLLSDAPDSVRAELRGPSGRLTRTTLADVIVGLDLSGVGGPGEQTFTLSSSDFALPQGVTFLRAVPSQLRLNFDRILEKEVPVQVRLKGDPPDGYSLTGTEITPRSLRISGPATHMGSIQNAQTDEVNLAGLTQTTSVKVNAFVADARAQFESPPLVTVTVTIGKTDGKSAAPATMAHKPNTKKN
jgi:hypothetical protein